jgi:hypothetical protein
MFYLTEIIQEDNDVRSGKLTHKSKGGIKGTKIIRDHEALCPVANFHAFNDGKPFAYVAIGDHTPWKLGEYEAMPSDGNGEQPIARWYWNKTKPAKGFDSTAT